PALDLAGHYADGFDETHNGSHRLPTSLPIFSGCGNQPDISGRECHADRTYIEDRRLDLGRNPKGNRQHEKDGIPSRKTWVTPRAFLYCPQLTAVRISALRGE